MIQSLGKRLRVKFHRAGPGTAPMGAASRSPGPSRAAQPMVDFVAYAEDCLLSGRVRLRAERLTDMLNEHDEIQLVDVMVERLDSPGAVEVREVVVRREEILLVHATGPRGDQARRQRTRQHPLAMRLGRYDVHGYLHALPGSDPLTAIRRRKVMVPLTEASIEYLCGGVRQRRRVGAVVVNREQIDVLSRALEEEVETLDIPVPEDQGPLVKDFTGHILGGPTTS